MSTDFLSLSFAEFIFIISGYSFGDGHLLCGEKGSQIDCVQSTQNQLKVAGAFIIYVSNILSAIFSLLLVLFSTEYEFPLAKIIIVFCKSNLYCVRTILMVFTVLLHILDTMWFNRRSTSQKTRKQRTMNTSFSHRTQ